MKPVSRTRRTPRKTKTVSPMIEITREEYDRLKLFELGFRRKKVQASLDEVLNLEDDIDQPLRNSMVMLSLMGCTTVWSCCGFDYTGQSVHKFHEYGSVYIRIKFNEAAYNLGFNLIKAQLPLPWNVTFYNVGGGQEMQLKARFEHTDHLKMWDNVACPHYAEAAAFAIYNLERTLLKFRQHFLPTAVIHDTNGDFQHTFKNWQYSPKKSWTVTQNDVLKNFPIEPAVPEKPEVK